MTFQITRLQFSYTNHRGEDHVYLVAPIGGMRYMLPPDPSNDTLPGWYLDGQVIQRDGEDRPGIRSFRLTEMRDIQEVGQ